MDDYENIELEDEIIDTPESDPEHETDDTPEVSENIEDDSGESEEDSEDSLTDRLDALIEILTPEESEEKEDAESVSETSLSEDVVSAPDPYSQELLESINVTLFMIKSENVSYHSEMLVNQEQAAERQEHISESLEFLVIALFVVGFFVALSCGCSFADTFFNRMKG